MKVFCKNKTIAILLSSQNIIGKWFNMVSEKQRKTLDMGATTGLS